MKEDKVISGLLMTVGAVLMLASYTGITSTSILTGVLVFSTGSISLLLSKPSK